MLHWRNNNYSYLTKYVISDFGAQLSPRLFPLILFIIIIYYSCTRESRISLIIITLWSNILKFRLQIERFDFRRDV